MSERASLVMLSSADCRQFPHSNEMFCRRRVVWERNHNGVLNLKRSWGASTLQFAKHHGNGIPVSNSLYSWHVLLWVDDQLHILSWRMSFGSILNSMDHAGTCISVDLTLGYAFFCLFAHWEPWMWSWIEILVWDFAVIIIYMGHSRFCAMFFLAPVTPFPRNKPLRGILYSVSSGLKCFWVLSSLLSGLTFS